MEITGGKLQSILEPRIGYIKNKKEYRAALKIIKHVSLHKSSNLALLSITSIKRIIGDESFLHNDLIGFLFVFIAKTNIFKITHAYLDSEGCINEIDDEYIYELRNECGGVINPGTGDIISPEDVIVLFSASKELLALKLDILSGDGKCQVKS